METKESIAIYENVIRKVLKENNIHTLDALVKALCLIKYIVAFSKPLDPHIFYESFEDKEEGATHVMAYSQCFAYVCDLVQKIEAEGKKIV